MRRLTSRQLHLVGIFLLVSATFSLLLLFNVPTNTANNEFVVTKVTGKQSTGKQSKRLQRNLIIGKSHLDIITLKPSAGSVITERHITKAATFTGPSTGRPRLFVEAKTETISPAKTTATGPLWGDQKIPKDTLPGFLNVHIWDGWCGSNVDQMHYNKHFPNYPDYHTISNMSFSSWKDSQYGQRLFGYIHPPKSGAYEFALTSDDSSEMWLSTSEHPAYSNRIVRFDHNTYSLEDNDEKPKVHASNKIALQKGRKYFMEILHKQFAYKDYVALGWKIPGSKKYHVIRSSYLSTYYHPGFIGQSIVKISNRTPTTNGSYCHYQHRHDFTDKTLSKAKPLVYLNRSTYADQFRSCLYEPSYIVKFNLTRYEGVYLVHGTSVYPNDNTKIRSREATQLCIDDSPRILDSHGNLLPDIKPFVSSHVKVGDSTFTPRIPKIWSNHMGRKLLFFKHKRRKRLSLKELKRRLQSKVSLNLSKLERTSAIDPEEIKLQQVAKVFGTKWAHMLKGKAFRDETVFNYDASKCRNDGNVQLNEKVALFVAKKFFKMMEDKEGRQIKLVRVVNVEENHDLLNGDRYLVEIDVMKDEQVYRLSEYVYMPQGTLELCHPQGFSWDSQATVHVIIPVKNQGKWLLHFIKNMDQIYLRTGDDNFNVIIVDFESNDIDIHEVIKEASLKRYQIVKTSGPFQRALGLQVGADAVKNPNDIIFMCDLHLQIPETLIEAIRKHCVQSKMTYAPIVNRLDCGFNPESPRGAWEIMGFGLFGMYKSDFDAVGGMNTNEFKTTWGGEDWELVDRVLQSGLEIERMRLPNFYHYHHSKKRMWNSS